ncbi:MAG: ABC transporter permease [Oscillospiraceae bacterium]|nr:ABC transporter permease [Oscillospiraceae bacterium]
MLRYIAKRLLILVPVVIAISIILFGIIKLMPGDPVRAMLPTTLRGEQYQAAYAVMSARLGMDKPVPVQYLRWMHNLVIKGDLGYSSANNRPVVDVIREPLVNTIRLNIFVNIFYLLIALPVGIKMATKRGSLFDSGWQVFSIATYSIPSFFLALSLIFIFGVIMGVLPLGGMPNTVLFSGFGLMFQWARYLTLPIITLTIIGLASAIRYVRNAMIDALSQDYIRTARSKGLSEKVVIYSHAFRNALIPVSTIIVWTLFSLLMGSTITESVFQYNGIGKLLLTAVNTRDTMLIVSMNMIFAVVNVSAMLIADVIYGLVDPRIKLK